MLGLMRDENSFAAQILRRFVDVTVDAVREYAAAKTHKSSLVEDEGIAQVFNPDLKAIKAFQLEKAIARPQQQARSNPGRSFCCV